MDTLKLMIVEDEEAHFKLMKRAIVKDLPHASVYHFQEATACLESLDEINPDIIIADYLLPNMNGIELLETLNRENRDIPVIIVTGQGDENIAVQAIKLGAWDYLVKSVDFFTLLPSVIEKVISEWKQKELLRKSERRFQDLAERTSDWIWETDTQGSYIYSNPIVEEVLGFRPDEVIGKHFFDFFAEKGKEAVKHRVFQIMEEKRTITSLDNCLIHKAGNEVIVETKGVPVFDKAGKILGYRGVHRDISERKQAEDALLDSEAQKRAILDASIDRIMLVDKDMRIIWANKTTIRELNRSPEDLVGQICYKIFVGRDTLCSECPTKKAMETGQIERAIMLQPKFKGIEGESYWDVYCVPLKNELGAIVSFIQVARDITDKKQAQEHIHTLTQQLIKVQENERHRISRDLHDIVAQDLCTLKISFETLFNNLPHEISQRISGFSKKLQESITIIRDMSYDLHPPILDQLGLVHTIAQYCDDFSKKTGLSVDFTSAGMDDLRLNFDTEINLYRLIQEGLNNIKKHADASHVGIRLLASFPNIILRIEDNGRGFDVKDRLTAALDEKRMGLRSMKERVGLLQGKMRIQSHPDEGTIIYIEVPYKEKKSGSKEEHIDH